MNKTQITMVCAALAAGAPAWGQGMSMPGMLMPAAAASSPVSAPVPAPAMPGTQRPAAPTLPAHPGMTPVAPSQASPASAMSGMPMPGSATPTAPGGGADSMPGMSGMAATVATPPSGTRTADAYSDGYTLTTGPYIPAGVKPPRLADQMNFGSVLIDRLEAAHSDNAGNWTAYDVQAWFGRDFDRLVVKAEGQESQGRLQDARTELLWGHAVAAFWDAQAGVRHDSGGGPDRNWLALGIQGLAPYWFDVEATAYLGDQGRSALRLAASYDLMLTQRWVLQPRVDADLYGKDDPERGIGSGLSDATAGLRLRYEITRQFAPYIGVEWSGRFGRSADFARAAGERPNTTDFVAGLRFWF